MKGPATGLATRRRYGQVEDEDAALERDSCDLEYEWRWRFGSKASASLDLESRAPKVSLKDVSWPTNAEVAPES